MRSRTWIDVQPPTLRPDAAGGTAHQQNHDLFKGSVDAAGKAAAVAAMKFATHWNNADVRGVLYAIFGWSCGYCLEELTLRSRGDVDHFRPKAGRSPYWWLAYNIRNYVLSCSTCNRINKRSKFPLTIAVPHNVATDAVGLTVRSDADLTDEPRLLMHPILDPVDDWIDVDLDADDRVLIVPRADAAVTAQQAERIAHTIDFFELNYDPGLNNGRQRARHAALSCIPDVNEVGDPRKEAEVKKMAAHHQPQSGVVRRVLLDTRPDLLPTPAEERCFLVDGMLDELIEIDHYARFPRGLSEANKRDQERLLWALAAATLGAVGGEREVLDKRIEERRPGTTEEEVEERRVKLMS